MFFFGTASQTDYCCTASVQTSPVGSFPPFLQVEVINICTNARTTQGQRRTGKKHQKVWSWLTFRWGVACNVRVMHFVVSPSRGMPRGLRKPEVEERARICIQGEHVYAGFTLCCLDRPLSFFKGEHTQEGSSSRTVAPETSLGHVLMNTTGSREIHDDGVHGDAR